MSASERILALIHRELDKEAKCSARTLGTLARAYQLMRMAEGDSGSIDLIAVAEAMKEKYDRIRPGGPATPDEERPRRI